MFRDVRNGVAVAGLAGAMLLGVASVFPAVAALDPDIRLGLTDAVIDDPGSAVDIAAEAAANVCPAQGAGAGAIAAALEDVREVFRTVAERAIIEQDPSDPAPAAAIAEAVIAACPQADAVVASELEALIQTAAGGLLPPPGPGEQGININSPSPVNQENAPKSEDFHTRLLNAEGVSLFTQDQTTQSPDRGEQSPTVELE